ncbi:N-acetylglucosamine-6-phosphate deacetylase [Psychrobacillus psychrotolerans]|uniref:N-acetylglucosamine-6-phosphate deacetylase n=2 Tax=Psychrobacillus psychrotolerans TaxID=126156 RepID=A0A1I6AX09_9BACI|nr:N-acetylglucosamine-6-phosphate deacetylase [Psychrobacillus psychrotolerans]SFQ73149.1 N-acetylglucosamine-6-phosphate deacetylase [Psychrobacillus psychrotolerans]
MSKTILISNVTIVNYDREITGDLFIRDGKVEKIGQALQVEADIFLDGTAKNWIVMPGFIDMHIHGSAGFDMMDATEEALRGMSRSLVKEGTTSYLPTTITQRVDAIEAALENVNGFVNNADEAEVLGIHVEGPYISTKWAGAQPIEHITEPSIEQFLKWQQLSGNRIKQVTVAPEVVGGFEFVQTMSEEGIISSIGHSDASSDEVEKAVRLGAKQATHLYNQMRPFHHRDTGVVGSVLLEDHMKVEIIVDYIHSHMKAVNLAYRLKGAEGIILITDAMRAKGLEYGEYDLGGQTVYVTEKGAHLSSGALAGSILTMDQAVRNMKQTTGCSLQELVSMSSTNAAKQLKLSHKGYIDEGFDADLVILDLELNVQKTICRGNIVFES